MTVPVHDGFVGWPDTEAERYRRAGYWKGEPLGELPRQWARRWPDRRALVEGDRSVTFAELEQRVQAVATGLRGLGLRGAPHGDRILVQLPNSVDLVVLVLAASRLGVVPVLALPGHRESDLRHLAALSEAVAIAVPDTYRGFDHAEMARTIAAGSPHLRHILISGEHRQATDIVALDELAAAETGPDQDVERTPSSDSVALLLLSGGTTGTPKLIPRTHDDYVYNLRASAAAAGIDHDTVAMFSIPVAHNFGLGCPGALGTLEVGGTVVLEPSPEPQKAFRAISQNRVTHVALVPAVLQRWMDYATSSGERPDTLRAVHVGGARLADEVAGKVMSTLGARVQQALGMAEGLIAYTRVDDDDAIAFQTQGRPISEADEIRVVGPDGRDVAHGEVGELWARGPYTIRGYWRAPEHNARAFDAEGWYKTGDLVRLHGSGNIVVEGRIKDVINRAGEKISAEEVENAIYALPSVAHVAVVAQPDPARGERVAAAVVLRDAGSFATLEELRDLLTAAGMARHKLPESLLLLDELPLTKVGKIDRMALRESFAGLPTSA